MDFNSITFFLFLPLVFALYWLFFARSIRLRSAFILAVSYVFYGWWDWRFLLLILFSTVVDFSIALLFREENNRKLNRYLLGVSLCSNLALLGFFKYFGFFTNELYDLLSNFGLQASRLRLEIILPVGISFYTFQTLSYTIDVYNRRLVASNNFMQFAAYVSFFPQLVAGPIERASSLLPQFKTDKQFKTRQIIQGFRLICWGLFKKVVVADSLAPIVNQIFETYTDQSGLNLVLGAVFFAFQIYCDFSGYSDIAIGSAKLLGFELMSNFKFPYFSRDIAEFWRRWHISLSAWFRDYVYIPIGGSRGTKWKNVRNVFVIFLISGFWHGANWTFIAWGALHAILFLPLQLLGLNRTYSDSVLAQHKHSLKEWSGVIITFIFVCLGWVFFRADSLSHAFDYLSELSLSFESDVLSFLFYPLVLILIEWHLRSDERLSKPFLGKWEPLVLGLFLFLVFVHRGEQVQFIYFQF